MVYYLETRSTDPYYNLAFEEYVLTHRTEGDYLLLWQNDNTVVVGRNQNTAEEINADFVEAHHIRVVRRGTGGGAVYHDLGNLNYSFITDAGEKEKLSFARFTEPVVKALCELGLSASASGRNDILVDGCKVSGTAQRLSGDRVLHHGTLLFDSDPSLVGGADCPPGEVPVQERQIGARPYRQYPQFPAGGHDPAHILGIPSHGACTGRVSGDDPDGGGIAGGTAPAG